MVGLAAEVQFAGTALVVVAEVVEVGTVDLLQAVAVTGQLLAPLTVAGLRQ